MRGKEFIKLVQRMAKARGLSSRIELKRGKGSHVTLYLDKHFTVVRNPKDELKPGTFHAMLKQLGIHERDL